MSTAAAVRIDAVSKRFGEVKALDAVSLDIRDREFFTLLGPSGCGKTTLLRLLAGFEDVSAGEIRLFGENIARQPPNQRPVNTVFQHYALFPQMTVAENVAFGLHRLGRSRSDTRSRVAEMLALVQLEDFAMRRPAQLSGGQQQRVALARALAPQPKLLLLDEPLSALDLKLRQAMRVELKRIQQRLGITFVFVTHDQEEALTMSDRVAVMSAGQVQQVGTPREVYELPVNRFVADFIGETNLLDVDIVSLEGGVARCTHACGATFDATTQELHPLGSGHVSVRPEGWALRGAGEAPISGTVMNVVYLGTDTQHVVRLGDGTDVVTRTQSSAPSACIEPGTVVSLALGNGAARLLRD